MYYFLEFHYYIIKLVLDHHHSSFIGEVLEAFVILLAILLLSKSPVASTVLNGSVAACLA